MGTDWSAGVECLISIIDMTIEKKELELEEDAKASLEDLKKDLKTVVESPIEDSAMLLLILIGKHQEIESLALILAVLLAQISPTWRDILKGDFPVASMEQEHVNRLEDFLNGLN